MLESVFSAHGIKIPPIAEHDTWISLDPIVGCPARCAYCYTIPLRLANVKPATRFSPSEGLAVLDAFLDSRQCSQQTRAPVPVAIGNYTDMFMAREGIAWVQDYLLLHAARFPAIPVCLITKARLHPETVAALDSAAHPVYFFLSQSFMQWYSDMRYEKGPVSTPQDTIDNIRVLRRTKHLVPLHFWRPLTRMNLPSLSQAVRQLALIKDAGCRASIAVGLKLGEVGTPSDLLAILGSRVDVTYTELIEHELLSYVHEASRRLSYPVYRNTSCAIALASQKTERLGTWQLAFREERCLPCYCPQEQRARCGSEMSNSLLVSDENILRIAAAVRVPAESITWNQETKVIRVACEISQDQHAAMVHAFGCPVYALKINRTLAWLGAIAEAKNANRD